MAINIHGFTRNTEDIDLLIELKRTTSEGSSKCSRYYRMALPKNCDRAKIADNTVVRVCDEITVDLMAKACGYDYESVKTLISPL